MSTKSRKRKQLNRKFLLHFELKRNIGYVNLITVNGIPIKIGNAIELMKWSKNV